MAFGVNPIKQDFGQTISTVADAQRNTQFQTALQERFDVNSAKIEEAIQRVSAIPLLRDKDKEYLQKNMSNILNNVNANIKASGGRSLLNNNMSGQLTKLVGSSIDDYLVEQMSISAQKQQFDTQVAEERKKNPETFNNDNYQFSLAQAGWNEYMEGKDDFLKGGLQYVPYSDWSANATKKAAELAKIKGKREIEIIDPNNPSVKIKKSIDGLRPEEVAEYLPNLLSSQDMQQMRIDGWAQSKRDPEGTKMQYNLTLDTQLQKATQFKKASEAILNSATASLEDKENAKRQIDYYNQVIQQAEEGKNNTDLEMMGYTVAYTKGKDILESMLSTEESISYEANDIYFKTEDLRIKQAELEISAEKSKREKAVAEGTSTEGFQTTVMENQTPEVSNVYSTTKNLHDQAYNTIIAKGVSVLDDATIDEGAKDIVKAELLRNGFKVSVKNGATTIEKDPNDKRGISKANAVYDAILKANAVPKSEMVELKQAFSDKNRIARDIFEANKKFSEDVDTDELVERIVDTSSTLKSKNVARIFDFTENAGIFGAVVSPITSIWRENEKGNTPEDQKRIDIATEIDAFISNSGGIEKLKKDIKNNPSIAQKLIDLENKAAEADMLIYKEDSKVTRNLTKAGEYLEKKGYKSFIKDKYNIQLTTEGARESIINTIDQNQILKGKGFDAKKGGITIEPTYNTRGEVENFIIKQYNTENKDGAVITEAVVAVSSLTGQTLLSKTKQGEDKDALSMPKTTTLTPLSMKISQPFPTDTASTDAELNDFMSLGLAQDGQLKGVAMFLNSNNGSVKDNILNYAKSQLIGQYTVEDIEYSINAIEQGFKTGEYTTNLKVNKLPSIGTAKWVLSVEKDGVPLIPTSNFTETPILPKNLEKFYTAYPQYVVLNKIIEQLKAGKIQPTDL